MDPIDRLAELWENAMTGEWEDDGRYIAAMHNAMPRILDMLKALRKWAQQIDAGPGFDYDIDETLYDAYNYAIDVLQEGGG